MRIYKCDACDATIEDLKYIYSASKFYGPESDVLDLCKECFDDMAVIDEAAYEEMQEQYLLLRQSRISEYVAGKNE